MSNDVFSYLEESACMYIKTHTHTHSQLLTCFHSGAAVCGTENGKPNKRLALFTIMKATFLFLINYY